MPPLLWLRGIEAPPLLLWLTGAKAMPPSMGLKWKWKLGNYKFICQNEVLKDTALLIRLIQILHSRQCSSHSPKQLRNENVREKEKK